jgi:ATP-dependent Clp protease ATP-binding subunit ClpC
MDPELPYNRHVQAVDRLTTRAQIALGLGNEEALKLHHSHVGTEHILLGILGVPESTAARVLHESGLGLSVARSRVTEILGPVQARQVLEADLRTTVRAKRVIGIAFGEADRLGLALSVQRSYC